jgi:hypothetical protein
MTTNQSDQQPPEQGTSSQQQGTKKRAGSISRYATLGKASERLNVQTPRSLNAQESRHPNASAIRCIFPLNYQLGSE